MAIEALHKFLSRSQYAPPNVTLVLAGGFDARLPENVQHLQELKDLVCCLLFCLLLLKSSGTVDG
jgi:hypothetical protein